MTIRHSYEFDTLPSERTPKGGMSPAHYELQRLAQKATFFGPNGFGNPADVARREQERTRQRARWGEDVGLTFNTRPGAFIEREKPEVRERLQELRSDEAQDIDHLDPPWILHDFTQNPEPQCFWRLFPEGEPSRTQGPAPWPWNNRTVWTFKKKT